MDLLRLRFLDIAALDLANCTCLPSMQVRSVLVVWSFVFLSWMGSPGVVCRGFGVLEWFRDWRNGVWCWFERGRGFLVADWSGFSGWLEREGLRGRTVCCSDLEGQRCGVGELVCFGRVRWSILFLAALFVWFGFFNLH
ncbi:hypothetical protein M758_3G121700 [Ceratodon purpureus]|nr:hypothetical protein M758_3G121700 [Ceratodon purpureus]